MYKDISLITMSPHPVFDKDGNGYTVGQGVGLTGPKYNIVMLPADGEYNSRPFMNFEVAFNHSMIDQRVSAWIYSLK